MNSFSLLLEGFATALTPHLARPARVAMLKGWQNYACVHKLAGGYPPDDAGTLFTLEADHPAGPRPGRGSDTGEESLGEQVVRLRAWAEETTTGDRDDLVPGVGDRAWPLASSFGRQRRGRPRPHPQRGVPVL